MTELNRALPDLVPIRRRFDVAGSASTTDAGTLIRATERSSGRTVGLRRLSPEFTTDPQALARLLELEHPNLLPVREILRDKIGVYLITDWAGKGTLADRLAGAPPDASLDAMILHRVARGVSRALHYLHERNVAPARLQADQILETEAGLFQVAGFGVPEQSGEETSFNPCQEDSDSIADRFQLDLIAFATLIEGLRAELPPALRALCARCRPDASRALKSAGDLSREIEQLPDVLSLPEPDQAPPAGDCTQKPPSGEPRSADQPNRSGEDPFPWRPMEDLYRIEGSAMKGGMGSVWMATERSTGRKVAIKRLHRQEGRNANELTRFYREAQSIAHLSHPHILQLLQPARDAQGDYLVLEWAAGGSLRERLGKSGPLPPDAVLEIARKIGGALSYAHAKGVIHRDIKPHNILLTETGEPKLADFGLARSVGDATLSSSRGGAGSPLYMPPEQYDDSRKSDARSDLYSLGKTLYQLLTNKSPASPLPELLPKRFRAPLSRCMESDPDARPASIDEFLRELNLERKRPLLPLLSAAVVLLAAGWIYSLTGSDEPAPPISPAGDSAVAPPNQGGPGLGVAGVAGSAKVVLAGLFTGQGGAALAPGEKVDEDRVEIQLRFDPPPPAGERPEITVRRGQLALPPQELETRWGADGEVVLSVPLVGRDNRFEVEVPDRSFKDVLEVIRMDPEPVLTDVSGAQRIDLTNDHYLTFHETVELQLDVAHSAGIGKLWLAHGETRTEVPIERKRIVHSVKLVEGENAFSWYWPDESQPLAGGRFRILADFTPPQITLESPKTGLVTNQNRLSLTGKVRDARPGRPGKEVSWQLLQGGQVVASGTPATEVNGTFNDEAQIPPGRDGEMTLECNANDEAGNAAELLQISLHVDRKPPQLEAAPRFEPTWDEQHRLVAVSLAGQADEPLASAVVNDQEAELTSATGFRTDGLQVKDGEAYTVVLTDAAGNPSVQRSFPHGVDVEPPAALRLRFLEQGEQGGELSLSITPSEPLSSLTVDGAAVPTTLSESGEILAPISGSLEERTTWKRRTATQAVPGPTQQAIEVVMVDGAGNPTTLWLVICPEDRASAVRCTVDDQGQIAGTEPCPDCHGRYCPRTGPAAAIHLHADGLPEDTWLTSGQKQCGYCRWPKP